MHVDLKRELHEYSIEQPVKRTSIITTTDGTHTIGSKHLTGLITSDKPGIT